MNTEVWKASVGREGYYEVSSLGRVRSVSRVNRKMNPWGFVSEFRHSGRVLRPQRDGNGYACARLSIEGVSEQVSIHRLIAEAFLGTPPFARADVNHIDGRKDNNVLSNLEWCTRSENMRHARRMGLHDNRRAVLGVVPVGPPQWFPSLTAAGERFGAGGSAAISNAIRRGHRCAGLHWQHAAAS